MNCFFFCFIHFRAAFGDEVRFFFCCCFCSNFIDSCTRHPQNFKQLDYKLLPITENLFGSNWMHIFLPLTIKSNNIENSMSAAFQLNLVIRYNFKQYRQHLFIFDFFFRVVLFRFVSVVARCSLHIQCAFWQLNFISIISLIYFTSSLFLIKIYLFLLFNFRLKISYLMRMQMLINGVWNNIWTRYWNFDAFYNFNWEWFFYFNGLKLFQSVWHTFFDDLLNNFVNWNVNWLLDCVM